MQSTEVARLGKWFGRLVVGALWVVAAGVAGAVGADQAEPDLDEAITAIAGEAVRATHAPSTDMPSNDATSNEALSDTPSQP